MTQEQIDRFRKLDKKRDYWAKVIDAINNYRNISIIDNHTPCNIACIISSDNGEENDVIIAKVMEMARERLEYYKEEIRKI